MEVLIDRPYAAEPSACMGHEKESSRSRVIHLPGPLKVAYGVELVEVQLIFQIVKKQPSQTTIRAGRNIKNEDLQLLQN